MHRSFSRTVMVQRASIVFLVAGFLVIICHRTWVSQGGTLPLSGLRSGMTRAQVESLVGPTSHNGKRSDGSSYMVITWPKSQRWLELEFDATDHLRSFQVEHF